MGRAGLAAHVMRAWLWLRYWWASELDLMVRLGGLRLRERYQDGVRGPLTGESQDHITV